MTSPEILPIFVLTEKRLVICSPWNHQNQFQIVTVSLQTITSVWTAVECDVPLELNCKHVNMHTSKHLRCTKIVISGFTFPRKLLFLFWICKQFVRAAVNMVSAWSNVSHRFPPFSPRCPTLQSFLKSKAVCLINYSARSALCGFPCPTVPAKGWSYSQPNSPTEHPSLIWHIIQQCTKMPGSILGHLWTLQCEAIGHFSI